MSIYDNRNTPAYRWKKTPKTYSKNPHILKWWNESHDGLLAEHIEKHQWDWPWHITDEILTITAPEIIDAWKAKDPVCKRYAWRNVLMYFAMSRAESLGLTLKIRKPKWKTCPLCNQKFVEDSLPSPFIRRLGIDKLDFCSPCLTKVLFEKSPLDHKSDSMTKDEVIEYVKELVGTLERVPTQNIGIGNIGIRDLDGTDTPQRLELFRVLKKKPTMRRVRELFGSWFRTLIEANILEDGAIQRSRGVQCLARDGHVCFSLGEKTVDDFLYQHNISHDKEQRYPEGNFRADFSINGIIVEYFGLKGNTEYDSKTKEKEQICEKHGIKLISIYPEDLLSIKKLEKKLRVLISQ
jgi:hypothetical protein